ncbi:MAG: SMP-30/gluconolactonase/LRE family protein [Parvularculales bacterium]
MTLESIPVSAMEKIGIGLDRPEDVVVGPDGRVWASDHLSACAEIMPDGSLRRTGKTNGAPNGINMDQQCRIIIANFGIYDGVAGPLQRLDPESGDVEVLVSEVGGQVLTSSNYPVVATDGTIWCTHSTFAEQWPQALDGRTDGFVYRLTPDGIVHKEADGLKFANGCCLDAEEEFLYVNQTSGGNVVRFPIGNDGSLGVREDYGPMLGIIPSPPKPSQEIDLDVRLSSEEVASLLPSSEDRSNWAFTDGNGFDEEGNLWVTLPAANKVVAITPAREVITIAHDPTGDMLNHPTNVTWGGADRRDIYFGSIVADYVVKARSPVAGMAMVHQR